MFSHRVHPWVLPASLLLFPRPFLPLGKQFRKQIWCVLLLKWYEIGSKSLCLWEKLADTKAPGLPSPLLHRPVAGAELRHREPEPWGSLPSALWRWAGGRCHPSLSPGHHEQSCGVLHSAQILLQQAASPCDVVSWKFTEYEEVVLYTIRNQWQYRNNLNTPRKMNTRTMQSCTVKTISCCMYLYHSLDITAKAPRITPCLY